jgi:hypothetical protein
MLPDGDGDDTADAAFLCDMWRLQLGGAGPDISVIDDNYRDSVQRVPI